MIKEKENKMAEDLVTQAINASRIPDTIKLLPTYDGEPKLLKTWIDSVESILNLYRPLRGNPIFNVWLLHIKHKLIGKASDALTRTPLVWNDIKQTLIEHFGDQRDLTTLSQNIPFLKQNEKSITEFYHECSELYADMNAKISLDNNNEGHVEPIMRMIGAMIRDAFVDGLNEPYSSYTRNYRPGTLIEAFQCASEQYAAHCRRQKRVGHSKKPSNNPLPQPTFNNYGRLVPARPIQANYNNRQFPTMNNQFLRPPNQFPRPLNQPNRPANQLPRPANQFPKPSPMEVDSSQRYRRPTQFNNVFRNPNQQIPRPHFSNSPNYVVEELTCTEQNPLIAPQTEWNDENYQIDTLDNTGQDQWYDEMNTTENTDVVNENRGSKFSYCRESQPQHLIDCIPYIEIFTNKQPQPLRFLIDTGANKNYIKPDHVNLDKCKTCKPLNVRNLRGISKIDKFATLTPFPNPLDQEQ